VIEVRLVGVLGYLNPGYFKIGMDRLLLRV